MHSDITILVVDDHAAALYAKSKLLSHHGYCVLQATCGQEALALVPVARPTVVMLDAKLPDISGFEVCKRLKTESMSDSSMVLMTSAVWGTAQDRIKALESRADAYLIEPAEEEELLATIRALVRIFEQERQNRSLLEKLTRTERLLREATEAGNTGLWDWNIQTGALQWFGTHDRLAGMEPGTFSGKVEDFTNALHADDRASVWRKIQECTARQQTKYSDQYRFVHRNGSIHWMEATGQFYYDEHGRPVRMTGVIHDITAQKEAEDRLRQAVDSLALAQRVSHSGVWDWLMEGNEVPYISPEYRELYGVSPDEPVTYEKWLTWLHPEDRDRVDSYGREFFAGRETEYSIEFRIRHPERGERWLAGLGRLQRDTNGQPIRFTGINIDITESRRTSDLLRIRQAELAAEIADAKLLQEISSELIHEQHVEGLYQKIVSAAMALMRSDWATMQQFYSDALSIGGLGLLASRGFEPEAIEGWQWVGLDAATTCAAAAKMGQRVIVPNFEECAFMAGTPELEAHLRGGIRAAQSTPLITRSGEIVGMITTHWRNPHYPSERQLHLLDVLARQAADLLERSQRESELRESEYRLRLALAGGQMGTWDVNLVTNQITWDAKELQMFGFQQRTEPIAAGVFYECVHPDDRCRVREAVRLAIEASGELDHHFRIIRSDGEIRWLVSKGMVLADEQGRPCRILGINYDITDIKVMEQKLRSFAEQLEMQVADRTDELVKSQTELRSLATELTLAEQRERKRLAAELHDHLQQELVLGKIKLGQAKRIAQNDRCAALMDEVDQSLSRALDYTRTLVADLSPAVLRDEGLGAGLKWLGEYMKKYDLTVTVTVPDENLMLPEDQTLLLFQSVRELLINSWKHAGTGEASVTVKRDLNVLRIEVHDNGKGFAAAETPGEISSKFGLFSIRERMAALGGGFEIVSVPGTETTCILTVPIRVSLSHTPHGIRWPLQCEGDTVPRSG